MTRYGNRYERRRIAGEGGIGTVVVCHDPNLEREVAIKFLQSGVEHRRILDELHGLLRVRSKHAVEVLDVVYDASGQLGIVQEHIDGEDLARCANTVRAADKTLLILYQVAVGLRDVHASGIIHRDIKPSNVMLSAEGLAKIIDFNLARQADRDSHTLGFVGTRGFAAPEQYVSVSNTAHFTSAIDVFALGALAVWLITGGLPAEFLDVPPRIEDWIRGSGGFARLLPDTHLAALFEASLNEAPGQRPSADQLASRLAQVLLKNRHRALLVGRGLNHQLDSGSPGVTVSHPRKFGSISIRYDGIDFVVTAVQDEAYINNRETSVGSPLPGSSVITLGAPSRRNSERLFITLDISHPEVVL